MDYKVIITGDAEADMDKFVQYLLFEKKNEQAAGNLLDDFEATIFTLAHASTRQRRDSRISFFFILW